MQIFAIKHRTELTWEDLPFVEAPVFAHTHIMQMLNNPNHLWMRIDNILQAAAVFCMGVNLIFTCACQVMHSVNRINIVMLELFMKGR